MKASITIEADFGLSYEDTQMVLADIVQAGALNADREYQKKRWPEIKSGKINISLPVQSPDIPVIRK